MVLISLALILMAKWASRRKPTMTGKRKKLLQDQQNFVKNVVKEKKVTQILFFLPSTTASLTYLCSCFQKSLYTEYLEQTVSEHDL